MIYNKICSYTSLFLDYIKNRIFIQQIYIQCFIDNMLIDIEIE